jgi:RNA polymerase sigma-70 factor (ECF subfamily)
MTAEHALPPGDARAEGAFALMRRVAAPLWPQGAGAGSPAGSAASDAVARPVPDDDGGLAGLLDRIAHQDERALGEFYDATSGRVYGLALRITGRADTAEEVAADTYFQVWRDAARYQAERGRVLAWLLTICRSRAIDALRRRDEAQSSPDPEQLRGEDAAAADDPGDLLLLAERDGALQRALAELSALQRQLLALAFFRGLTHEEIAAHAGLPLGSVKTHIRKALARLRELLASAPAGEAR